MKKKIFSAVMAMTMVMGLSLSAFADDAVLNDSTKATTGQEITGESDILTPTIKVTVPTSADIVVNPFQLKSTISGTDYYDQIVSVPQTIKNESNVGVEVNVEGLKVAVTGAALNETTKKWESPITVMTGTAKSAKTKSIYLYLAVGTDANEKDIKAVADHDASGKEVAGASLAKAAILEAGDSTPTTVTFQIKGDVNANPTKDVLQEDGKTKVTVADPWVDDDAVTVKFKFTFTPIIGAAPAANP